MERTYISKNANFRLREYLESLGRTLEPVSSRGIVSRPVSDHPDVFLCRLGIDDDAPVYSALAEDLGPLYPRDCAYNAACTGRYFIHNFSCTAPVLLEAARRMNMVMIDVKQGYAKCSIVIVDADSIITYDEGIIKACARFPELSVLRVRPGFVRLDGHPSGFIGGTSGRVGDTVVFNGDLSKHPDFARIVEFIETRGLKCKWFPEYQLTDIGSII